MKQRLLLLLMLALAALACGQPGSALPTEVPPAPSLPPVKTTKSTELTIAVEYAILGVAQKYADFGATYAKIQNAFSIWGNLEPEPGDYRWGPLDALVLEYQRAGFTGLQILLSAHSPWASRREARLGDLGDTFPKEEYLDNYVAFVTEVVERYDYDGQDDLPGLQYPIHHYGIEREFTGFWPGSAVDYVRLLRLAYPAIKAADPQAEVLLVALLVADAFDGNPPPEEVERRLAVTPNFRKSIDEIGIILAACDAYDIVDFHSLADYTEIPPTAAWIRQRLAEDDCPERDIWIGDAFSMSALVGYGGFVQPIPFAPATVETRDQVIEVLKAVADPADPGHEQAWDWLQVEMAGNLVKKIIVSAGAGLRGINLGNMEDWKTNNPSADIAGVPMLGTSLFMGMTETTVTARKPGGALPFTGHLWSNARQAGEARPALLALGISIEKLEGYRQVEQLSIGEGVWAYRFDRPAGPLWVLWYDDGELYLPGNRLPTREVRIEVGLDKVRLTRLPGVGESRAVEQDMESQAGVLVLRLNAEPVFVEELK